MQVLDGSTDWRHDAACLDEDPELFFPIGKGGPAAAQIIKAKAVCAGCPVLEKCRAHGLSVREPYGVWGGLTEEDREEIYAQERKARREQRKAAAAAKLEATARDAGTAQEYARAV